MELVGPIPGRAPEADPEALTVDDFAWTSGPGRSKPVRRATRRLVFAGRGDGERRESRCRRRPAGGARSGTHARSTKTRDGRFTLDFTDKDHRLAGRRGKKRPRCSRSGTRARSGIESTNSGLKNRLGLGQLASAWSRERVPCAPAQSHRLERAASGGVGEAVRLGEAPSGPDAERGRIWAECAASCACFRVVGELLGGTRGSSRRFPPLFDLPRRMITNR